MASEPSKWRAGVQCGEAAARVREESAVRGKRSTRRREIGGLHMSLQHRLPLTTPAAAAAAAATAAAAAAAAAASTPPLPWQPPVLPPTAAPRTATDTYCHTHRHTDTHIHTYIHTYIHTQLPNRDQEDLDGLCLFRDHAVSSGPRSCSHDACMGTHAPVHAHTHGHVHARRRCACAYAYAWACSQAVHMCICMCVGTLAGTVSTSRQV